MNFEEVVRDGEGVVEALNVPARKGVPVKFTLPVAAPRPRENEGNWLGVVDSSPEACPDAVAVGEAVALFVTEEPHPCEGVTEDVAQGVLVADEDGEDVGVGECVGVMVREEREEREGFGEEVGEGVGEFVEVERVVAVLVGEEVRDREEMGEIEVV